MTDCVLDASAILACLNGEPGAEKVVVTMHEHHCFVTTVNWVEVVSRLLDWGMPAQEAEAAVASLEIRVVSFDSAVAQRCAVLRPITRPLGLSLGDRACLALAQQLNAPVLTADRPWLELAAPLNLDIRCIRPDLPAH